MRLSRESLDILLTPQYQEYKRLNAKSFDGDGLGFLLIVASHLLLLGALGLILRLKKPDDWETLYIAGILIPYCWAPVIWIVFGLGLNDKFYKAYRSRSERSHKFQRLQYLKQFFPDAEKSVQEQIQKYCHSGVRDLVADLRKTLKGTEEFQSLIDDLDWNHRFIADAKSALSGSYLNIRSYVDFLHEADIHFERDLGISPKKPSKFRTRTVDSKPGEQPKQPKRPGEILGIGDSIKRWTRTESFSKVSPGQNTQKSRNGQKDSTGEISRAEPSSYEKNSNLKFKEESLDNTTFPGEPVIVLPPRQSGSQRLFHAPPDYYVELADRRTEIGRKGEEFVIGLERKKVLKELGKAYVKRVIHKALEADGFGYDIESIEDNRKIYIEVKTTVGSKRAGIVFTHTEFSTMEKKKDSYYLYRVFNFDTETQTGDFEVYRGRDDIVANFDISYQNYVLRHK